MPSLGNDVTEGGRERQTPLRRRCPVCGNRLTTKGGCLNSDCLVYSIKGGSRGRGRGSKNIVWCSSPRLKPLSTEEVRSLLEPYLTPDVERLLEQV
ncbi:hypothetical protein ES703_10433 [subsurface metagenome]